MCSSTIAVSAPSSAGRASTCRVWPGRPFFMSTGVSQASSAPASSSAGEDVGPDPGVEVVDVGLQHDGGLRRRQGAAPAVSPTTSRTTFARSGTSRLPAPTPTAAIVIAGSCPDSSASVVASATPVGWPVRRRPARRRPPHGRRGVRAPRAPGPAGRREPCGPSPIRARRGRGPRVDPRRDDTRADADDVRDRVEGADLVEVHLLRADAVHVGLGGGETFERPQCESADRRSQRRRLEEPRTSAQVRDVPSSPVRTSTCVARSPARVTGRALRRAAPGRTASTASCRRLHRDAEVHEGAEQHVPGDAGGRVDPERARHGHISPHLGACGRHLTGVRGVCVSTCR